MESEPQVPIPRINMPQLLKKRHFAKVCKFENRKRHEIKKITERQEAEESDTDTSINIKTEIKHLTDRRNHITMTLKIDGTEKEFIVDTGSPVTILPSDKQIMKDKKLLPVKNTRTSIKTKSPERLR